MLSKSTHCISLVLADFEAKTVAECALRCTLDRGCLSFDAGNPLYFQAGDCFGAYDTSTTVKTGDYLSTYQLDLYEKNNATLVLSTAFTKVSFGKVSSLQPLCPFMDGTNPIQLASAPPRPCSPLCVDGWLLH